MTADNDGSRGMSAVDYAYDVLRRAIIAGELRPGERLTGTMLTERLGVSRTPVRAALVRLEAERLVETARGHSAWVRPLTAVDVEDAYNVAQGVECALVVRLCDGRASEAETRELLRASEDMQHAAAAGDKHGWAAADEQWHTLLVLYGRSPLMSSIMVKVEAIIGRVRLLSLHLYPEGAILSAQDHASVAHAIREGDELRAQRLHHEHWERARKKNLLLLVESVTALS